MTLIASAPEVQAIDLMIGVLSAEIVLLAVNRRLRGVGLRSRELVAFLGAGLFMLVGLRVMIAGGPFVAFAAAMLVSLGLHLWHVRQRWQRQPAE